MKVFRSIKWRLQLWYGILLLAVLGGFGYTAYQLQSTREFRRIDQQLHDRMATLIGPLRPGRPPGPAGPPPFRPFRPEDPGEPPPDGPRRRDEPQFPSGEWFRPFYYAIWGRDGRLIRSENLDREVRRPDLEGRAGIRMRKEDRELVLVTPRGDTVLVGRSIAAELADLRRLALLLFGMGGLILAGGIGGGWVVASRAMRPINRISEAAVEIASGDLSRRIEHAESESELGRLVSILNSTFARLEASFAEQARFTTDVSHELRTPVTVIVSQTQTVLARERNAVEYRESLEACQRAAQRMRTLIESLLQLARFDAGQELLNQTDVDLVAIGRECVDLLRPLAAERGIDLTCDLKPVCCRGDSDKISQVITNLLKNAIQYTSEGGRVSLATTSAAGLARIVVADTGCGMSREELPHIFERFYRVDKSRARDRGGSGLGLAISRAIVNAHGGSISVASLEGEGSQFTVELPGAL